MPKKSLDHVYTFVLDSQNGTLFQRYPAKPQGRPPVRPKIGVATSVRRSKLQREQRREEFVAVCLIIAVLASLLILLTQQAR